ncbi:hypothetical protein DM02DRAFT_652080 [Periconia macrospinosa]|uniref:N-acetyltransferase domain-containing protein n=1 Tax=Periconia macrospinosa TaxID=97972 RepID=A0A2V1E0I7_9PLEO|nr:hypothetical protein DM02DRAFT_652080 [Periconia macrospinosa]
MARSLSVKLCDRTPEPSSPSDIDAIFHFRREITPLHKMNLKCFLTFISFCGFRLATGQQQILGAQPLLRNASLKDADDIADVMDAAFSPTPSWQYLYPFSNKYPKEHHRCVRFGVVQALKAESYHIQLIEAPAENSLTVAAVAIWRQGTSQSGTFAHQLLKECEHRDMNLTRAIDMERKSTAALRKYVNEPFGSNQLYLDTLCTHPDFQLHGAATRLVGKGIEVGRKDGVNVTVVALPTAESFYIHIGFYSIRNFSISSFDEDEYFRYNVMAYNFTSEG